MDTKRFDALTRAFARPSSRRAGLKAVVGLAAAAALRPQEASALVGFHYWPIQISRDDVLVAMSVQATQYSARTWPVKTPKGVSGKQFVCDIQGIKSTALKRFCQVSSAWSFVRYNLVRSNIKQVASGSWNLLNPYPGCAVYVVDGSRIRAPGLAPAKNGNETGVGDLWGVSRGKADLFEFGGGQAMVVCADDGSVKVYHQGRVLKSVPPGVCMRGEKTCPAGSEAACCPGDQECCDTGCCSSCFNDETYCPNPQNPERSDCCLPGWQCCPSGECVQESWTCCPGGGQCQTGSWQCCTTDDSGCCPV